ncbi:hypothetical protein ON010_g17594 [Phytophthora cinnamomi]|nr:hypothetical protein ON010_g17594 [Phytophthora cinnamomi]
MSPSLPPEDDDAVEAGNEPLLVPLDEVEVMLALLPLLLAVFANVDLEGEHHRPIQRSGAVLVREVADGHGPVGLELDLLVGGEPPRVDVHDDLLAVARRQETRGAAKGFAVALERLLQQVGCSPERRRDVHLVVGGATHRVVRLPAGRAVVAFVIALQVRVEEPRLVRVRAVRSSLALFAQQVVRVRVVGALSSSRSTNGDL